MVGKEIVDTSVKVGKSAEKVAEGFVKKAWSIMDASATKEKPSHFLSDQAIKAMQGRE